MNGVGLLMTATLALGIKWGWQPVAGGGIEYIIQIEPQTLDSLKSGQDLYSDLPPTVDHIRSYRITVGDGPLPHQGEAPPSRPPEPKAVQPAAEAPASAPTTAPKVSAGPDLRPPTKLTNLPPPPADVPKAQQLEPPPQQDPLVQPAGGYKAEITTEKPQLPEKTFASHQVDKPITDEPAKSWWALTASLLGLFASFGLNLYLGMIAWDQRARYKDVVARIAGNKVADKVADTLRVS